MMRGTFFGLEIGRTGLTTAQFGLDVTGHNIANLDTEGFTRQRIVSTAKDPFAAIGRFAPTGDGQVGGGVRIKVLDQIRSSFLDRRFRTESTANAYWETRTQSLTYIESFFDNVNELTSLNSSIAEFFRSMTIVSQDPVSGAPRTLMQTTAMDLVQQLNMIYDGLMNLREVENRAVETKTGDINRIAEDIAELNEAIYRFELTGLLANDLRDKRNLLLDNLARLVDIEYGEEPDSFDNSNSMMWVAIGGVRIVDHTSSYELTITNPEPPATGSPIWAVDGRELDMSRITGGEVRAHIDMRDGTGGGVDSRDRGIPYYIEMINNLARALVQEINAQHVQGWTDEPGGSRTGILFFDDGVDSDDVERVAGVGTRVGSVMYLHGDLFDENGDPVTYFDPFDPNADWSVVTGTRYSIPDGQLQHITARNLTLSEDVERSAFNIAASDRMIRRHGTGDSEQLQSGNNYNMRRLHGLFSKTDITLDLGGTHLVQIGSFDDYVKVIRFDVGNTLRTAKLSVDTSRILTLAANNQRTSIAGVSLDEEMVNLVRFNHAYNGAARVITAMDDALDRLINGTGRVGL